MQLKNSFACRDILICDCNYADHFSRNTISFIGSCYYEVVSDRNTAECDALVMCVCNYRVSIFSGLFRYIFKGQSRNDLVYLLYAFICFVSNDWKTDIV